MSYVTIPDRFVVKRDTAANFTAANTLLLQGEWALELDTGKMKMGDGSTAWNSLPYKYLAPESPCFIYTTDTGSTADSDPGAGLMKWNNATQSSATKLFFDDSDTGTATDLSNLFAELAGSSTTGILHMSTEDGEFQVFKWTAIADGTGYFKFTVAHLVSSAAFADNVKVRVVFHPMPAAGGGGSSNWTLVERTSDLPRASTTTFADDTQLVTATLAVGVHAIRGSWIAETGAGQIKWQGAFSGTATAVHKRKRFTTNASNTAGLASITTTGLPSGTGQSGLTIDAAEFEIFLNVTVAGAFSIQWAQQTSNAANTTMKAGSRIEHRKVA